MGKCMHAERVSRPTAGVLHACGSAECFPRYRVSSVLLLAAARPRGVCVCCAVHGQAAPGPRQGGGQGGDAGRPKDATCPCPRPACMGGETITPLVVTLTKYTYGHRQEYKCVCVCLCVSVCVSATG